MPGTNDGLSRISRIMVSNSHRRFGSASTQQCGFLLYTAFVESIEQLIEKIELSHLSGPGSFYRRQSQRSQERPSLFMMRVSSSENALD
eukprot:scaffold9935_cov134-Cylindrotheca_fusiformis.AAC.3